MDTTCPECGGYVLECRNQANEGVYEVQQDRYCYRRQALDDLTSQKGWRSEPGQLLTVEEIDESVVARPVTATLAPPHHEEDEADGEPPERVDG